MGLDKKMKKLIDQYLDPETELEVAKVLAARFDLAKSLYGCGKSLMAMRQVTHNLIRLNILLTEAAVRRDAKRGR